MGNPVVPFLNIPRWPGEGREGEAGYRPPEEPPCWMPHSAEQSAFSRPEHEFELVGRIARDAHRFAGLESKTQRDLFLRRVVGELLRDPTAFEAFLDQIEEFKQLGDPEICHFASALKNGLGTYSRQPDPYSEASLGAWLDLHVRRFAHREAVEEILGGILRAQGSEKALIDFLYALTTAGVTMGLDRGDPEIIRLTARVICCDTNILESGSRQHHQLWMAMFSPNDDTLKHRFELGSAMSYLGAHLVPEALKRATERSRAFHEEHRTVKRIDDLARLHAERMQQIVAFLEAETTDSPLGKRFVFYPEDVLRRWPASQILTNNGPLRESLNEFATQEHEQAVSMWLPGRGDFITAADPELPNFILSYLTEAPLHQCPITCRGGIAALYHLSPELSVEQRRKLSEDARALREEIFRNQVRYVSPRGDRFVIEDPILRALGFKSILFEEGSPRIQTDVTMEVGNYQFKFTLDRKHNLREFRGERGFPVASFRKGYFEQVVLGYFHALVCGDETVIKHRNGERVNGEEAKRRFNGMRGHRRRLPAGRCFSAEQAEHYRVEKDGDLARLNHELGLTRQTGQITFVKSVDAPNGRHSNPFEVVSCRATYRLAGLLAENSPASDAQVSGEAATPQES